MITIFSVDLPINIQAVLKKRAHIIFHRKHPTLSLGTERRIIYAKVNVSKLAEKKYSFPLKMSRIL